MLGLCFFGFLGSTGTLVLDAADDGLDQSIVPLLFPAKYPEEEFGFALGVVRDADGKGAAGIIVDEGVLVAEFAAEPGIDTQRGEVARLAFGAARAGGKILRVIAFAIGDAIEFEPGERANVGGL